MTKLVTKQSLLTLLTTSDPQRQIRVIGRALVALFNRQTETEKSVNDTTEDNARGFSGADAKRGSLTAKYFLKHGTLLEWQRAMWLKPTRGGFPRICKYHKQLNEVALNRIAQ